MFNEPIGSALRQLFEEVPLMVALLGVDHRLIWANRSYQKAAALSSPPGQAVSCYSVWGFGGPCPGCPFEQVIRGAEVTGAVVSPPGQGAEWEPQVILLTPLTGADGALRGVLETRCPAGERTAEGMAEPLRREHDQLLSVLDSIDEAIYVADMETYEILFINRVLQQVFPNASLGGICYREFQGLQQPCSFCTNEIISRPGHPMHRWEYHNPLTERDYAITDRVIRWPDGRKVRFEIATDITERKQAERTLKRRLEYERLLTRISRLAAREGSLNVIQEQCVATLGETLGVSRVYIFEHRHTTDTMDNTFEWVAPGISPQQEKLQGLHSSEMSWWTDTLKKGNIIRFEDMEDIPDEGTKEVLRAQDILSVLVVPLFVAGSYYGFIGFDECRCRRAWPEDDVYLLQAMVQSLAAAIERHRAAQEKEILQNQLAQAHKLESIGRLAGGVAHDFNNMLGVILGHAELASAKLAPAHPLHADLESIRKAAQHSADLTRQLLAFARKQTISPRVLDLNRTVEGSLNLLRRIIGEDIALDWKAGANLGQVRIDPSQIEQILTSLAVNARDAIKSGGRISIATQAVTLDEARCQEHSGLEPGEYVVLTFSDDGCGMDRETLARIFDPFFTTKELGQGIGLGLATVYGIVRQNDGMIDVASAPLAGTTFTLYLPRAAGAPSAAPAQKQAESARGGSETILLVEDEPALLEMGKAMLERLGYRVLAAHTPGEALKLARENAGEIQLLMTDVVMPEMNGRELAKRLLALYPEIRRLFMSGYTADALAHHGVVEEGVYFLQKPFTLKELSARVREVLGAL